MIAKEVPWFRHDFNARRDPKLIALRLEQGIGGLGRYWILVEILREQPDYRLKLTKWTPKQLAGEWDCNTSEAQAFLESMVKEIELFKIKDGRLYSESLIRRMQALEERNAARAEAARTAANARWMRTHCDRIATAECDHATRGEGKGIEGKGKEGKDAPPAPVYNPVDKMRKINPALQVNRKLVPVLLDACERHGSERMLAAYAGYQRAHPGKALRFFLEDYGEYLPAAPAPAREEEPRCPACRGPLEKDEELYGCAKCRTWYRPNGDGTLQIVKSEKEL
jgi:hypothetical protein